MINAEENNLLTLKEYNTIMSEITGIPFVDKTGACYMFELPSEADLFCKNNPHTYKSESKHMKGLGFWVSDLYLKGVKSVNIKVRESSEFQNIAFSSDDIKQNLYDNHETNYNLLQLKQYGLAKSLRALSEGIFIAPIIIPERADGDYPKIKYCFVQKNGERMYILFTNLKDFQAWNTSLNNQFSPLATNFLKAKRIRKGNSLLINPTTDKIILTNELLQKAMEKKK